MSGFLSFLTKKYICVIIIRENKKVRDETMDEDLITRINNNFPNMSKGQKKLSNYILSNYETAVFMTATKLGATVGVSESTTVRFANLLGYDGFPQFHSALEQMVKDKLKSVDTIDIDAKNVSKADVLSIVMRSDANKIEQTLNKISVTAFEEAVENIMKAKKIYILGIRNCLPLAEFLGFYLRLLFENVEVLNTNNSSEIFEQMIDIGNQDVFIGISFPRYSFRTLKAMEFASDRNATVIAITDSINSPINLYSSCNLIARSEMASVVDSLVAPLSVINALIVSLCMKKPDYLSQKLEMIDKVWENYQVYSGDEIDIPDDKIDIKDDRETESE